MRWLLVACVLWSCDSEVIQDGVCGNGILDPLEDCDRDSERCSNCSITCDADGGCSGFDGVDGFVCGPDGLCHAPAGTFEHVNQIEMPASSFLLADVEVGGPRELIVQSDTTISAVFSIGDETLTSTTSIQTPLARGPAEFADIDDDATTDVYLPTADGIVAYTNEFGAPSPYPFPSPVGQGLGEPLFVRPVTNGVLGLLVKLDGPMSFGYVIVDVRGLKPQPLGLTTVCGASTQSEDADRDVEVFDVRPREQVVVVRLSSADSQRLCMITIVGKSDGTFTVTDTPVATTAVQSRAVLADLRDTTCPSLVVREDNKLVEYAAVTSTPCAVASPPIELTNVPADSEQTVAAVVLQPQIAKRRKSAIVLETGIYAIRSETESQQDPEDELDEIYRSDRTISAVFPVDIDRDGDLDVLSRSEGLDGIDILDRRDTPDDSGFLRFRFDTEGPLKLFLPGDYDGDEHVDIAYLETIKSTIPSEIEGDPDITIPVDRLSIAYGTSDQLLPGAVVGTFNEIQSLVSAQLVDSTDQVGVISDLAVVFTDELEGKPVLSLLHGNPQRSMLAFFDPRELQDIGPESQFRGVIAGRFKADSDVVAIEQRAFGASLYLSLGSMGGELANDLKTTTSEIIDCAGPSVPPNTKFCVADAHYLAWPDPDDPDHDIVIGIDGELRMISFDPSLLGGNSFRIDAYPGALQLPARLDATTIAVNTMKRVDGPDGTPHLLVGFKARADSISTEEAALNLCTFEAGSVVCIDLSKTVEDELREREPTPPNFALACVDGDDGRVSAAARHVPPASNAAELILLCRVLDLTELSPDEPFFTKYLGEGLLRASFDLQTIEPLEVITPSAMSEQVQVGDISGDGLDDIVMFENAGSPKFWIVRQCTSREVCGSQDRDPMGMGDK